MHESEAAHRQRAGPQIADKLEISGSQFAQRPFRRHARDRIEPLQIFRSRASPVMVTADDGGDVFNQPAIISFGYTESFNAKLEVVPPADIGQKTTEGVDDPGQKPRLYPRNIGLKLIP